MHRIPKKVKKLALNSQILTVQTLTNDVQVYILCLSYFISTVRFSPFQWNLIKIKLETFLNIKIWGSDKHHNIFRIIIYSSFFRNSKLFFNVKMNRHFWQGWMLVTENKERSLSNRFRACLHIIIISTASPTTSQKWLNGTPEMDIQ